MLKSSNSLPISQILGIKSAQQEQLGQTLQHQRSSIKIIEEQHTHKQQEQQTIRTKSTDDLDNPCNNPIPISRKNSVSNDQHARLEQKNSTKKYNKFKLKKQTNSFPYNNYGGVESSRSGSESMSQQKQQLQPTQSQITSNTNRRSNLVNSNSINTTLYESPLTSLNTSKSSNKTPLYSVKSSTAASVFSSSSSSLNNSNNMPGFSNHSKQLRQQSVSYKINGRGQTRGSNGFDQNGQGQGLTSGSSYGFSKSQSNSMVFGRVKDNFFASKNF